MAISTELDPKAAREQVAQMTAALDNGDVDTYLEPFAEDARFRFANQDPVHGRENIRQAVVGALDALGTTNHTIVEVWHHPDTIIAEFSIGFHAGTDRQVTLPCVSVIRLRDNAVVDYRITMDVAPVFAGPTPREDTP